MLMKLTPGYFFSDGKSGFFMTSRWSRNITFGYKIKWHKSTLQVPICFTKYGRVSEGDADFYLRFG